MPSFFEAKYAVPVLETERLRLREFRLEDFPNFVAMLSDPEVMRYFGGKPVTEEELWGKFIRNPGHWILFGFGNWVIEDRLTKQFVGTAGLAYYKREFETAALKDMPEISYLLVSKAHGKGYATEAVGTILAWSGERFGERPTKCLVSAQNRPSLRVAEKAGYRELLRTHYRDQESILFTRVGQGAASVE